MNNDEVNEIVQPSFTSEPSIQTEKHGWWYDHPYNRLNVKDYVRQFCGWKALTELIQLIYDEKQKAFFVTLFLTGGRVTEVLLLMKSNFEVERNVVEVTDMRLLKKYKKLDEYIDPVTGKPRWHTEKFTRFRKPFTIQRREPFTPILEAWIKKTKDSKIVNDPKKKPSDVYLFPSPQSHSRRYMKNLFLSEKAKTKVNWYVPDANGEIPYTLQWAYLIIRDVNNRASQGLKKRLGLLIPFRDKEGKKIADEIHLFLHWFRSQRASQLAKDYKLGVPELVDLFEWEDMKTAIRYAKMGGETLTEKMSKARVQYV